MKRTPDGPSPSPLTTSNLRNEDTVPNELLLTPDQLIAEFDSLIQSMATVAHRRVKQPPAMTLDDLFQEGRLAAIMSYTRWWKPDRGASLKTFLTRCIMTTYADIVKASYRDLQDTEYGKLALDHVPDGFTTAVLLLEDIRTEFSREEQTYLDAMLQIKGDRRSMRRRVRETLGITSEAETALRDCIKRKIQL